jgi:hypothetical protein
LRFFIAKWKRLRNLLFFLLRLLILLLFQFNFLLLKRLQLLIFFFLLDCRSLSFNFFLRHKTDIFDHSRENRFSFWRFIFYFFFFFFWFKLLINRFSFKQLIKILSKFLLGGLSIFFLFLTLFYFFRDR